MPTAFAPDDQVDPPGSGVYVPKAMKYPWAPDTYYAFPVMYFDYEAPGFPRTRRVLASDSSGLGSGQVETQVAVSRDGVSGPLGGRRLDVPGPCIRVAGKRAAQPVPQPPEIDLEAELSLLAVGGGEQLDRLGESTFLDQTFRLDRLRALVGHGSVS